jgi:redox-sensitive bicupin YhaK (pirin superfamily)
MEIISYVLEGALAHRDSMGTGSVIRPGDVQKMSAGTGVTHSEFNDSKTEGARFLQIWVLPEAKNLPANYEQKTFGDARYNQLCLVASRDGAAGSLKVAQDMRLWASVLTPGQQIAHKPGSYKYGWLQVANGSVELNGHTLNQGDGVAITDEPHLSIKALSSAEVLVFDLS